MKIIKLIRTILTLVALVEIYVVTGIILLIYSTTWLFPEVWFLNSLLLKIPDLRLVLLVEEGILGITAMSWGYWQPRHIKDNWKTKLVVAMSLAYFSKYSFSAINRWGQLAIPLMTIVFFWYINVTIDFVSSITIKKLWQDIVVNKKYFKRYFKLAFIWSLGIAITGILLTYSGWKYHQQLLIKKSWFGDHPTITSCEPTLVFPSNKILIEGDHFGWRVGSRPSKLITNVGEVEIDSWTNEKIIFTVPLSWQGKTVKVKVMKPRDWRGQKIEDMSQECTIKVLNSEKLTPSQEKAYYEELSNLSPEAKELNGY